MKFIALLKKELRESLPFIIAAAVLLLLLGSLLLKETELSRSYYGRYSGFKPASVIDVDKLQDRPVLGGVGPLLWILSIALGLAIGIRQFWVESYSRTWGFEICRPTSRSSILTAKITAAVIGFIVSVGLIWMLFYWYASLPVFWHTPPLDRHLAEGWISIILGFIVYLGVAVAGLSAERLYTTRLFSLGFVLLVFIACFNEWRLWLISIFLIIGILILLVQVTEKFLNRQF